MATCTFGLVFSVGPVILYTLPVFIKPLIAEFGWTRAQVSLLTAFYTLPMVCALPFLGKLIDRYGVRAVVVPAIAAFGLVVIGISRFANHLVAWYLGFALIAIVSTGSGPLPFAKVLTSWFTRRRGLALGIAIAGVGVGGAVFPVTCQKLIETGGWRLAYLALGAGVLLVALPIVAMLLRNRPEDVGLEPEGTGHPAAAALNVKAGLTPRQALRKGTFWSMSAIFFLAAVAINGMHIHLPSLITDAGSTARLAAVAAGVVGVAATFGRVVVGWLLDRFFAAYVAVAFFLLPMAAALILAIGVTDGGALLAAFFIGVGIGAELDLAAYMTGRYLGARHFAEVYGYLFAAFSLGGATGVTLMGFAYDSTGSYTPVLAGGTACLIVASGLLMRLGSYPDWSQQPST